MEHITIKREKDVFNPENMMLGIGIFPAHATRDDESMFYGLTIEEADKLKELIPEGRITGNVDIFSSRQFSIMLYIDRILKGYRPRSNKNRYWTLYYLLELIAIIKSKFFRMLGYNEEK